MPRRRDDDDDYDDRPATRDRDRYDDRDRGRDRDRERPSRRGYECPFCRTDVAPVFRSRISVVGWLIIIFGTLLTCVGGLFGLLFREDYRVCPACNGKP